MAAAAADASCARSAGELAPLSARATAAVRRAGTQLAARRAGALARRAGARRAAGLRVALGAARVAIAHDWRGAAPSVIALSWRATASPTVGEAALDALEAHGTLFRVLNQNPRVWLTLSLIDVCHASETKTLGCVKLVGYLLAPNRRLAAPGTYVGLWVRSVGSIRLSGQSVLLLVRGLNPGI